MTRDELLARDPYDLLPVAAVEIGMSGSRFTHYPSCVVCGRPWSHTATEPTPDIGCATCGNGEVSPEFHRETNGECPDCGGLVWVKESNG